MNIQSRCEIGTSATLQQQGISNNQVNGDINDNRLRFRTPLSLTSPLSVVVDVAVYLEIGNLPTAGRFLAVRLDIHPSLKPQGTPR
jgi:hypothetical protein